MVTASGVFFIHRAILAEMVLNLRLPAVFVTVEAGGLAAYSASSVDKYRHAATYVDKILRGANPADLPIEQPAIYSLAINRKTAKALALTIPQELMLRADKMLE